MKKLGLFALLISVASTSFAATKAPLTLKVYNADGNSFHVNSTLVYGEKEAVVIDAGFTKADAMHIAANVFDSGKKLTTIFVSQADPDYYFGASTLKTIFPQAKVITTPAVRAAIKKKMVAKLAYWGPKMKENAPKSLLLPDVYAQDTLLVDGHEIQIKESTGLLAHRPYLWIPAVKAVLGNVGIYGDLHVWTADVQQTNTWQQWLKQLNGMAALQPEIVVPGHMAQGTALDASAITYTQQYLTAFSNAKKLSKNSEELANKMRVAYPDAQLPIALAIGSKVHMGEMKW